MYSFGSEPLEGGTQLLRRAEGKQVKKKKIIHIYQDILYARARARSFESPYKIDCALTTPELMLSGGLLNGVTQEESWQFCSCSARKSIYT